MALFAVGVFAFLWSYCNAVQRSRARRDRGRPAVPPARAADAGAVRRGCSALLAVQIVDRRRPRRSLGSRAPTATPGRRLALGFLVPMFGFGLNGLWAAYHGDVPAAGPSEPDTGRPLARRPTGAIGQNGDMAETASRPSPSPPRPSAVWAIAADVERYPDWAHDVKDVVVRSTDDERQRPAEVEFRASALGRSTHYTLAYDYTQAPEVLAWKMVKGDIQRSIEGAYHFEPDRDGGTEVRYDLAIELAVPLPGFVKRRAEVRILNTVRELKARAEA